MYVHYIIVFFKLNLNSVIGKGFVQSRGKQLGKYFHYFEFPRVDLPLPSQKRQYQPKRIKNKKLEMTFRKHNLFHIILN